MPRVLAALVFSILAILSARADDGATTLYQGGTFITLDPALPRAKAVLVSGGRIRKVFAHAPVTPPRGARVVDLKGATVVPGLHDAHIHVAGVGESAMTLDLTGTRSAQEVQQRVAAWLKQHQPKILVGRGWDQNDWKCGKAIPPPCDGAMPSRELLDAVSGKTPVILKRVDGHAAWVNSAALELAQDQRAMAPGGSDPSGGRILRDAKGEPTGVLVDNAIDLVTAALPAPSAEDLQARVKKGAERAAAAGLTSLHDMGASPAQLEAMRALDRRGELPVRIFVYLDGSNPASLEQLPAGGPRRAEGRVEVRGVKLFADGALGSRGAALLMPYADEPGTTGLLLTEPKALEEQARAVHARGFQVAIHAIGDRGNRELLEMYGRLGKDVAARRHRVEHAQVLNPTDFGAFKALGVIASMQPTHATSDMPWAEKRLGPKRLEGAYAWKSLQKAGAVLAFGSDAPVESERPLWGLYAARTRMDHAGHPKGGWRAQEALDGMDALRGFTVGAAHAVHRDGELGVIKEGALADFTLLDGDPTTAPAHSLLRMKVLGTVVDGVRVQPR